MLKEQLLHSDDVIITICIDNLITFTDSISLSNIRLLEDENTLQIMCNNTEIILDVMKLEYNELTDMYEYDNGNIYLSLNMFRK